MQLSLGMTTGMDVGTSLRLGRAALESGYSRIFVGEDAAGEIFTRMAVLAVELDSPPLASGVVSPFRHPLTEIATCSAGLLKLTQGRFALGLGPGERRGPGTLEGMRRAVHLLRERLREGMADERGTGILMGVRGRRMLSLAAEVSDGVILSFPSGYLPTAVEHIRRSAPERHHELHLALWLPVALDEPGRAKRVAAVIAADTPAEYFGELSEVAERVAGEVRRGRMEEACGMLPEELVEELCVTSEERLQELLREAEGMGIAEVILGPPFGREPEKVVRQLGV